MNIRGSNLVAEGITFKNTYYDTLEEFYFLLAEAVRIAGDKCAFFDCAFLGVQDTLFDHRGRHYFKKCYIQGGVDFIYGDGQSIYEECIIKFSRGREGPPGRGGCITANRGSSDEDNSAFVFKNCTITGNGKGLARLGRAYGNHSSHHSQFIFRRRRCTPRLGGLEWRNLTYVEEGCKGPGADKSKRVPWVKHMSTRELQQFVNIAFINQGFRNFPHIPLNCFT
ncbi:putative pectinesterase 29 [Senna tora]|uniref:pectinesterase n=1 Tax=Senna tora TaxID=362788 RepID=A0A834TAC4_9FABA|nr:putative pectinesterase 29 [Senna tora]